MSSDKFISALYHPCCTTLRSQSTSTQCLMPRGCRYQMRLQRNLLFLATIADKAPYDMSQATTASTRLDELSICVCRWQRTQNPPHDNPSCFAAFARPHSSCGKRRPTGSEAVCLDSYLAHPVDPRPFFAGISCLYGTRSLVSQAKLLCNQYSSDLRDACLLRFDQHRRHCVIGLTSMSSLRACQSCRCHSVIYLFPLHVTTLIILVASPRGLQHLITQITILPFTGSNNVSNWLCYRMWDVVASQLSLGVRDLHYKTTSSKNHVHEQRLTHSCC